MGRPLLIRKFLSDFLNLSWPQHKGDAAAPFLSFVFLKQSTASNSLADIKALGRCCTVSKRFHDLASQVDNVVVKVDCVISGEEGSISAKGKGFLGHLARFVFGSLSKPLQALQHLMSPKKIDFAEASHHSPGEVLRNFKEIQHLRIELPGGELGIEEGVLLKWKAEFGSTLESCTILGASSYIKPETKKKGKDREQKRRQELESSSSSTQNDTGNIDSLSLYSDGGLKLRVVWTISSLIAASARHYLLQQIISEHPTLETLVLTDADGQGMLCMGKRQLQEFRNNPLEASASSNRTQIPALNMKLWYAPYLELPGGSGLKGATLVAIRPSDSSFCKGIDGFECKAFEEPFKTAATVLAKGRTYLLEMNSF